MCCCRPRNPEREQAEPSPALPCPCHPWGQGHVCYLLPSDLLLDQCQTQAGEGNEKLSAKKLGLGDSISPSPGSHLAQALPLFSSKSTFKPHLLLRSKVAGPGGRRLDSSYRSAFDMLCDLEQVTALLWSVFSPVSIVALNAFRAQFRIP